VRRILIISERFRKFFLGLPFGLVLVLPAISVLTLPAANPEPASSPNGKLVAVYAPQATFSVPTQDRNGQSYVGLMDILQPLGTLSSKTDGNKLKLRFGKADAEFKDGSTTAKIRGKSLDVGAPLVVENGRVLVPMASLLTLLPKITDMPVDLHAASRRLFMGGVSTRFSAQVIKAPAGRLVLTFSSPVNPTIASEPGQLRLTFQHDPLLSNGAATLTFDDKTIPALNYREDNGAAEIGVQGTVPLLARFSADRKTITVEPVNQAVAQMPHPATGAGTTAPPATSSLPTIAASVPGALVPPVRVTVIIDAGHGGSERGAALSDNLAEKDVTLSFARTLQRVLQSSGVSATLLRDSDVNLTLEQRAISANGSRAQFYISIHATSMGTGTKIYTSLLPPRSQENRGPFLPWGSAQSSYAAVSQNLAASLTAELIRNSLSARSLSAPLPPLNHIACAAIAAEIAPSGTDVTQLNSAAYQEQVANALSAGIVAAQKSQVTQ